MRNLIKALIFILLAFAIGAILLHAPKGNDYIQWERDMIESNQMEIEQSEYFNQF